MTPEDSTAVSSSANLYTTRIAQTQNPLWHATLIYEFLKDNPLDLLAAYSPYTDYEILQGFWLARNGQFDDFLLDCSQLNLTRAFFLAGAPIFMPNRFYPIGGSLIDPAGHLQTAIVQGMAGATPTWNDGGGKTTTGQVIFQDEGLYPGADAQALQVVTDGTTYYSPLQRNFGGQFLEDITDLNTSTLPLTVWADAVLQTEGSNFTVEGPGLAIPGYSFMGMYLQWAAEPAAPVTASFEFYLRMRFESDEQDFEEFLSDLWTIGGDSSKNGSGMLKMVTARPPTP